jgi:outer membrane protein assembly factor BamD
MKRSVLALVFLAAAVGAGCGLLPDQKDETLGWSAQKLYGEAKDAIASRTWD